MFGKILGSISNKKYLFKNGVVNGLTIPSNYLNDGSKLILKNGNTGILVDFDEVKGYDTLYVEYVFVKTEYGTKYGFHMLVEGNSYRNETVSLGYNQYYGNIPTTLGIKIDNTVSISIIELGFWDSVNVSNYITKIWVEKNDTPGTVVARYKFKQLLYFFRKVGEHYVW